MNAPFGSVPFGGAPVDTTVRPKSVSQMLEEDLRDTFFGNTPAAFTVMASVEPAGETAYYVPCIYDRIPLVDQMGVSVQGWEVTIKARASTVAAMRNGDKVVVNSTSYVVSGTEPDGTGVTIVHLTEAINV